MNFKRFPEFGKELRRPFEVCSRCYDCVEFYGEGHGSTGCNAWPAGKPFRCGDFYPLPPVGINGETGQHFPPSRMQGRKEPRELSGPDGSQGKPHGKVASPRRANERTSTRARTPGTAGTINLAYGFELNKGGY